MSPLANLRILVVEDEFLIAISLCDMLQDVSAVVSGPAVSVKQAMQLIQDHEVDAAILDINLNGQWSDPIADELKTRLAPFVFTTGYGADARTKRHGIRTIAKPYSWNEVEEQLGQALLESRSNES